MSKATLSNIVSVIMLVIATVCFAYGATGLGLGSPSQDIPTSPPDFSVAFPLLLLSAALTYRLFDKHLG